MRSGLLRGSIYWLLIISGRFRVSKTTIPDSEEHFLTPRNTNLFGGLGLKILALYSSSGSPEYPTLMPPPVEGHVRNHPRSK